MTAAEHSIVIEKGADFKLDIVYKDSTGMAKDINNYTGRMSIFFIDDKGKTKYLNDKGEPTDSATTIVKDISPSDGTNGKITIKIEDKVTSKIDTRLPKGKELATEYNYYYHIDIVLEDGDATGNDIIERLLRGRLAVRL